MNARSTMGIAGFALLSLVFVGVGCTDGGESETTPAESVDDALHKCGANHRSRCPKDAGAPPTGSGSPDSGTGTGTGTDAGAPPPPPPPPSGTRWMPKPGTSWQWQLSGTGSLDMSFDVEAYDIDLFDNTAQTIASLHTAGRKVICYFDTAYEPDRPDSAQLAAYRGNAMDGWPGEFWLDVTQAAVVAVMKARIALAQQKACDAIEADDVDSHSNNPGTGITSAEQQTFIRTLAAEAHARGMSYALKSDIDDVPAVLNDVDFDINEECFKYKECDALSPFVAAGKAVLEAEYTTGTLKDAMGICGQSNTLNFDTIYKHLDLDAARFACR